MDPPDLAQMAICGRSNTSKRLERNGKAEWGGIPVILVKGCLQRQEPCANFFNLRKNRTRSQELQNIRGRPSLIPPPWLL
jgi:hypothetical protein